MAKKTQPNQEADDENLHHPNDKGFKTAKEDYLSSEEIEELFSHYFYRKKKQKTE